MILFALYLLCLLFDSVEGIREAIFWYYANGKMSTKDNKSLHKFFMIVRIVFGFSVLLSVFNYSGSFIVSGLFGISALLVFPFIHDGFYYWKINQINSSLYSKTFMDMSNSSLAWTDRYFTPSVRVAMAVNSLAVLVILLALNNYKSILNLW